MVDGVVFVFRMDTYLDYSTEEFMENGWIGPKDEAWSEKFKVEKRNDIRCVCVYTLHISSTIAEK